MEKQSLGRHKLPTKWRRLRQLTWTRQEYERDVYFLKNGSLPSNAVVNRPARYRELMSLFQLEKGERYDTGESIDRMVFEDDEPPPWLLDSEGNLTAPWRQGDTHKYYVVMKPEINALLQQIWRDPEQGAFRGRDSMYNRVKRDYLGITQRRVLEYLESEMVHNIKQPPPVPQVVQPLRPQFPNEHWQIDLFDLNKFMELDSRNQGYRYVLNVQDIFSKHLWLFALPSKDAVGVYRALDKLVHQMGRPLILHSDNGGEFANEQLKSWTDFHKIEHRYGMPYTPTTQGSVERSNGTLEKMLKDHMKEFDSRLYLDILQHIAWAYNTTIHSTHRRTPYHVYFGREHISEAKRQSFWTKRQNDRKMREQEEQESTLDAMVEDVESYTEAVEQTSEALHKQVEKNINIAADKSIAQSKKNAESYPEGSIVRVWKQRGRGESDGYWIKEQFTVTRVTDEGKLRLKSNQTGEWYSGYVLPKNVTHVKEAEIQAGKTAERPQRPQYAVYETETSYRKQDASDPNQNLTRKSTREPQPKQRNEDEGYESRTEKRKNQDETDKTRGKRARKTPSKFDPSDQ